MVFGTVILLIFIVALSVQLSKSLQIEDILTKGFFKSDTNLRVEKINNLDFKEIDASKEIQKEVKVLLKELNLKRPDNSYSPSNAEYRIVSTTSQEDQLYLFVDENVIVFPHKNSTGYKIKNNSEFMRTINKLFN